MAVTYRAIERYSARRVSSTSLSSAVLASDSNGNAPTSKKVRQIIYQAASFYCSRLQSILRLESNLVGTLRLWLSNLILVACVTLLVEAPYRLLTAVAKWTFRWALTYYYWRNGIVCVTFDNQNTVGRNSQASTSTCWSLSVYLVDSGRVSTAELGRSIVESIKKQSALRLVRKPEAFGWIHLWQYPEFDRSLRTSVQELSPVWKHRLVTEDSVHEYVSEVFRRSDGLETNQEMPPWRIYLIPLLVLDPETTPSSHSDCCLVIRCHRLLCNPMDFLIHQVLQEFLGNPYDSVGRFGRVDNQSFDSLHQIYRMKAIGSIFDHPVHVSWTRPIPSLDFIDRMCHLTETTCLHIVLAAFCQSINQCYRQSVRSYRHQMSMEITLNSSTDGYFYKLPLGSSVLEEGQLVLDMLRKQSKHPIPYRMFSADPSTVLSVTMDSVVGSGICTALHWNSLPIPSNQTITVKMITYHLAIRLCLWRGKSTVRLGLVQHHQLVFPVKAADIERRIYQLAAGLGVQNRRPLSPHSSPSSSPYRLTPPPTPQLRKLERFLK